jgi:hypothetical protein
MFPLFWTYHPYLPILRARWVRPFGTWFQLQHLAFSLSTLRSPESFRGGGRAAFALYFAFPRFSLICQGIREIREIRGQIL